MRKAAAATDSERAGAGSRPEALPPASIAAALANRAAIKFCGGCRRGLAQQSASPDPISFSEPSRTPTAEGERRDATVPPSMGQPGGSYT